jgi:hypothetical protein
MNWKTRWNNLWAGVRFTDVIVAAFTAVLSFVAIFQYREMKRGGIDTQHLADAAQKQAAAADRFAQSAAQINTGIQSAVTQLGNQVGKMDTSISQARRLATATEQANDNVINADRPWMGGNITVADFEVGKVATFTATYTNTGKRPTRADLTAISAFPSASFPTDIEAKYHFDVSPSTTFVVPGQQAVATVDANAALDQKGMDILASGTLRYFVVSKIEYTDLKTNAKYWTHLCTEYLPKRKSKTNNGFGNCTEYNDAK